MNTKKKIEEEKLMNILHPPKVNREFKITIRFQKHSIKKVDQAFELAQKNPYFLVEGEGDSQRVYASFYPRDAEALHELFDLVDDRETTRLYLNNKAVPYIQELWLLLMWFYTIK
jgi:hypothetical protein